MRILVLCAVLGCLAGCIPIGIRGTSISAADSPSCVTPAASGIPASETSRDHSKPAPPRCA